MHHSHIIAHDDVNIYIPYLDIIIAVIFLNVGVQT